MTGFVCVAVLGADPGLAASEGQALSNAFADLHGVECLPVAPGPVLSPSAPSWAAGVGLAVVADDRGWTLRHGTCHGGCPHPVSVADLPGSDGQFSVVSCDTRMGVTVIATDRFATAPVHVALRDGLLYVSSSALTLARHLRPPVDRLAAGSFLTSGYQFGAQTHWVGIRRLDPGAYVEVSAAGMSEGEYWCPVVDGALERMSLQQTADHLVELYVDVLHRRLASQETWVDLTGGYDSRLLALLLDRAGVPFRANTRRSPLGPDVEIAGELVARTGWPWTPVDYPEDWPEVLPEWLDRALVAGDARLEVLQLSRVLFAHRRLAAEIPRLLSAGGGEHLKPHLSWKAQLVSGRRDRADVARWVELFGIKNERPDVLAPGVAEATREDFAARLAVMADRYADEPVSRQLDLVYAYKSTGHFGAYRAADDLEITTQLPYYFEPLFATAFSVPRRHRERFRLMGTMVEVLDARVAAVRSTQGGPTLPIRANTLHRHAPYYGRLARKGLNKVTNLAFGRAVWPYRHTYPWREGEANDAAVRHLVERGILDWADLRVADLLSGVGVEMLGDGRASSAMVGRVATLEMALARTGTSL